MDRGSDHKIGNRIKQAVPLNTDEETEVFSGFLTQFHHNQY